MGRNENNHEKTERETDMHALATKAKKDIKDMAAYPAPEK